MRTLICSFYQELFSIGVLLFGYTILLFIIADLYLLDLLSDQKYPN